MTFLVPAAVVEDTERSFRSGQHEVFVLWTSALDRTGTNTLISRAVTPRQRAGQTTLGVYVHIEGEELSRIQIANYRCGERSVVQLHTHPSADVNMSGLDREWEVLRHAGALSIIVPRYGIAPLIGFRGVNVYEREDGGWRLWPTTEVAKRLRVAQ